MAEAAPLALLDATRLTGLAGTQVLDATCGFLAGVFTIVPGVGKRTAERF